MAAVRTDAQEIQEVVEEVDDRPCTVKAIEVEVGEDSTGDPAAWIWLVVDPSVESSRKALHDVTLFAGRVQASVLERGLTQWPYVRLKVAVKHR
jgi:hypothetical protein